MYRYRLDERVGSSSHKKSTFPRHKSGGKAEEPELTECGTCNGLRGRWGSVIPLSECYLSYTGLQLLW